MALAEALHGDGLKPVVNPDEPQLTVQGITVRCERRASDDGRRLWYLLDGEPIGEADDKDLADARLAIRVRLECLEIEIEFAGAWHIFRSQRGGVPVSWCASRLDPAAGLDRTVIRDTAEQLRAALIEQRKLADAGPRPEPVIRP